MHARTASSSCLFGTSLPKPLANGRWCLVQLCLDFPALPDRHVSLKHIILHHSLSLGRPLTCVDGRQCLDKLVYRQRASRRVMALGGRVRKRDGGSKVDRRDRREGVTDLLSVESNSHLSHFCLFMHLSYPCPQYSRLLNLFHQLPSHLTIGLDDCLSMTRGFANGDSSYTHCIRSKRSACLPFQSPALTVEMGHTMLEPRCSRRIPVINRSVVV